MTRVETGPVLVRHIGPVAELVLNRPSRKNAINPELVSALKRTLGQLAVADVGAVLVRGAGAFFCSGLDTREIDPGAAQLDALADVHRALSLLDVPIVACVEGGAINAGAALVLACDLVVVAESAYLQIMEAAIGVTPPVNAAWLAVRHPASVAAQLALSCRAFGAAELVRMGIALDAVPDAEALDHSRRLAQRVGSYPRGAGRATKRVLQDARGERDRFPAALSAALATADALRLRAPDGTS